MMISEKIKKMVPFVLGGLLLISIGCSTFFFYKWQTVQKNPERATQKETADLISKVSRLMVLPEGEEPIIATVSDPEKLKEQAFFTQAKKGDKVLIFSKSQKAILYDPIADKIIEVAPTNFTPPSQN